MTRLRDPDLRFDDNGAPRSAHFDDIYFHPNQGAAESEFVFLHGNDLPDRWKQHSTFVIGETGFGTGLNFLLTWDAWRRHRRTHQLKTGQLHFVSVEGFPLSAEQLKQAHQHWTPLMPLSNQLCQQWPPRSAGFHRRHFVDDAVTLTLLFGEVADVLQQLEATVDAWYLDGFAPARNKAMWRPEVLGEIGRLSAPNATLATFTAAGFVRRGLAEVGFQMRKAPGFGDKRERLLGTFTGAPRSRLRPWFAQQTISLSAHSTVAIAGAGVAGRFLQRALERRGIQAQLYGGDAGASGNPAANIMPRFSADIGRPGRLFWSSFGYALEAWDALGLRKPVGALQLAANADDSIRQQTIVDRWSLPNHILRAVDAEQGSELAGVAVGLPGLWYPSASLVDGRDLPALAAAAPIDSLVHDGYSWHLRLVDGSKQTADLAVIAAGAGSAVLDQFAEVPLSTYRGQLTCVPATRHSQNLRTTLVNSQYLTPARSDLHQLGSTFDRIAIDEPPGLPSDHDNQRNLDALSGHFPTLGELGRQSPNSGWRGVRLTTPDRLPVVGPLANYATFMDQFGYLRGNERAPRDRQGPLPNAGLYALTALGARGFTTAPLLAELLVSQMTGEPWPLERELVELIHPARFWVRDLKRGLR